MVNVWQGLILCRFLLISSIFLCLKLMEKDKKKTKIEMACVGINHQDTGQNMLQNVWN